MKFTAAGPTLLLFCTLSPAAENKTEFTPLAETRPTVTPAPSPQHKASSDLAEKLAAGLPKFVPKKTSEATTATTNSEPDRDLPQNGIIRLPKYEVKEKPLPFHSERDLLTPKGKLDLALKLHPGFNFGPFKWLNHRRAMEWLAEDQQAERNAEMADLFGEQKLYERLSKTEKSKPPGK